MMDRDEYFNLTTDHRRPGVTDCYSLSAAECCLSLACRVAVVSLREQHRNDRCDLNYRHVITLQLAPNTISNI